MIARCLRPLSTWCGLAFPGMRCRANWVPPAPSMTASACGSAKASLRARGNPVDRNKRGTKRSQLCEGHGLPLAVVLAAANRNDMIVAEATLDAIVIERPDPAVVEQHLCMDAAYDYPRILEAVQQRGA